MSRRPALFRRRVMAVIAIVVAVLATTGSVLAFAARDTEPLPEPEAFRPGTCRTVAGAVLTLARLDRTLHDATALRATDRRRVEDTQKVLRAVPADPAVPLRDLVTALGYVRLRADTGTYSPAVWREADARRRAVQRACVRA